MNGTKWCRGDSRNSTCAGSRRQPQRPASIRSSPDLPVRPPRECAVSYRCANVSLSTTARNSDERSFRQGTDRSAGFREPRSRVVVRAEGFHFGKGYGNGRIGAGGLYVSRHYPIHRAYRPSYLSTRTERLSPYICVDRCTGSTQPDSDGGGAIFRMENRRRHVELQD